MRHRLLAVFLAFIAAELLAGTVPPAPTGHAICLREDGITDTRAFTGVPDIVSGAVKFRAEGDFDVLETGRCLLKWGPAVAQDPPLHSISCPAVGYQGTTASYTVEYGMLRWRDADTGIAMLASVGCSVTSFPEP